MIAEIVLTRFDSAHVSNAQSTNIFVLEAKTSRVTKFNKLILEMIGLNEILKDPVLMVREKSLNAKFQL